MLALCSQEEPSGAAAARRALERLVMAEPQVERRIAAILAADMVGFSRLMAQDEEATLAALNACRAVIEKLVARHRGRVFGSAGDSAVAEFASAVEAVRAALEIQAAIAEINVGRPRPSGSSFGSASTSATSWSTGTTCSATASTLPPASKPRPSPTAS
jgi:class 3 adenylate cyclase